MAEACPVCGVSVGVAEVKLVFERLAALEKLTNQYRSELEKANTELDIRDARISDMELQVNEAREALMLHTPVEDVKACAACDGHRIELQKKIEEVTKERDAARETCAAAIQERADVVRERDEAREACDAERKTCAATCAAVMLNFKKADQERADAVRERDEAREARNVERETCVGVERLYDQMKVERDEEKILREEAERERDAALALLHRFRSETELELKPMEAPIEIPNSLKRWCPACGKTSASMTVCHQCIA